jgi:hypothetical protein
MLGLFEHFPKRGKIVAMPLMAEHSVFRILFIPPTKTADSVLGGSCLPEVQ